MMQRKGGAGLRALGIASALAALAVLSFSMAANAQSDSMAKPEVRSQTTAYMRIVSSHGEIMGESKDPAHTGWIECREASMPSVSEITASNQEMASPNGAPRDAATGQASGKRMHEPVSASKSTIGSGTSGAGSGKASMGTFTVKKEVDKSSPILFKLASSGELIREVDIETFRSEAGRMSPAGGYKMTDVMVKSVENMSSVAGERPMESITFTYQKIEMTH